MEWIVGGLTVMVVLSALVLTHYDGYKRGRKHGFELGREKINEYALKVNRAQDERIKELESERNSERNDEIKKIADFLTKDISK